VKRERMNTLASLMFTDLVIGSLEAERALEKIEADERTGYLEIESENRRFLLFYEDGVSTLGFRVVEGQLLSFSNLAVVLNSLENGVMSFFETYPAFLQALLDMKFGEKIYGNLYTSFIDVRRLFDMLREKLHTGSIELDLSSTHCFVIMEEGIPSAVLCSPEKGELEKTRKARERKGKKEEEPGKGQEEILEFVLDRATTQEGVVRVFRRRNPPTLLCPDLEEVFVWSDPRRLKLEFAFGQLGKEFEELLDQEMTISQILSILHVNFEEIADMYTYLSAKGYIVTKKSDNQY
jgi:hypothetical protein